jgi:hypothetical protein
VLKNFTPNGAPNLPFYSPREGPGYTREIERERGKEERKIGEKKA